MKRFIPLAFSFTGLTRWATQASFSLRQQGTYRFICFSFFGFARRGEAKNEKQKEGKVPLRRMAPVRPRKSCHLYDGWRYCTRFDSITTCQSRRIVQATSFAGECRSRRLLQKKQLDRTGRGASQCSARPRPS